MGYPKECDDCGHRTDYIPWRKKDKDHNYDHRDWCDRAHYRENIITGGGAAIFSVTPMSYNKRDSVKECKDAMYNKLQCEKWQSRELVAEINKRPVSRSSGNVIEDDYIEKAGANERVRISRGFRKKIKEELKNFEDYKKLHKIKAKKIKTRKIDTLRLEELLIELKEIRIKRDDIKLKHLRSKGDKNG